MKNSIIFITLVVGAISFLISRGADESERKSIKLTETTCQKEVHFSDKLHDWTAIKVAKELLYDEKYTIESSIVKSTHVKSRIANYIQTESADKVLKRIISEFKKEKPKSYDNKLKIQYYIIENSRVGSTEVGQLEFRFLLDDALVYEARSHYIGKTGEDIPRRIKCIIKSFFAQ